jgi:hypothetical protein
MDHLMMLVDSHHSFSLQNDLSSNHRLHQKEKDTRKYILFFFFLDVSLSLSLFFFLNLVYDFNLMHDTKQRQGIKNTNETR